MALINRSLSNLGAFKKSTLGVFTASAGVLITLRGIMYYGGYLYVGHRYVVIGESIEMRIAKIAASDGEHDSYVSDLGAYGIATEGNFLFTNGSNHSLEKRNLSSMQLSIGADDDFDGSYDEDPIDGYDNDFDGLEDEDPVGPIIGANTNGRGCCANDEYVYYCDGYAEIEARNVYNLLPVSMSFGYYGLYLTDCCTTGDYVYLTRRGSGVNFIYKLQRSDLGSVASKYLSDLQPYGIATDGNYLYIAARNPSRIQKHQCSNLNYVSHVALDNEPEKITTDGIYVYVTSYNKNIISVYTAGTLTYDDTFSLEEEPDS